MSRPSRSIRAGRYDRRCQIIPMTDVPNAMGEPVPTEGVPIDVWCQYIPPGSFRAAREQFEVDRYQERFVAGFKVRYREGLTTQAIVRFEGSDYDIIHIDELLKREELLIFAEARDRTTGPNA